MSENEKPHKGRIRDWRIVRLTAFFGPENAGKQFAVGLYVDHPDFAGKRGATSTIVKYDPRTGEIETENSRYTLDGIEGSYRLFWE